MEAAPTEIVHELFQSQTGVQDPLPGSPGHDEGQSHGVQIDGAQHAFGTNFLVQKNRQGHAQHHGAAHIKQAEDAQVFEGHDPAIHLPQAHVLLQAHELVVVGQHA
jgi:hypothetical protein